MTTSERLIYLLGLNASLVTLLEGTLKVYEAVAPRGTTFPYLVYSLTTGQAIVTQDDSDNRLKGTLYTFKAYTISDGTGSGPEKSRALIREARLAFRNVSERPGIQSIVPGIGPISLGFSDTERAYGVAQEFQVWSDLD